MRAKLRNSWVNVRTSLWYMPTVFVLVALLLSSILIEVDAALTIRASRLIPWLVAGTADAVRAVLAVIAGSLISVISIAFSITIVAIQQTSAQFTPRVMRTFTADRGNQVVPGAYIGTFIYALLVLRQIRNPTDDSASFVPAISLTVALGLALVCLGLLIYFIHHISQLLQVSVIINNVHTELVGELDQLYPAGMEEGLVDAPAAEQLGERLERTGAPGYLRLRSKAEGFLRGIDAHTLV